MPFTSWNRVNASSFMSLFIVCLVVILNETTVPRFETIAGILPWYITAYTDCKYSDQPVQLRKLKRDVNFHFMDSQIHTRAIRLKSRKETPQKLTQLSSRSHPRHLVGNKTAQKTSP